MLFVLRAIFWLSLVTWLMSPPSGEDITGTLARDAVEQATGYCSANPATCLGVAQKLHQTGASLLATQQPHAVPLPQPRPVSLAAAARHGNASVLSRVEDDIAGRGSER
ncbi:hypothetical protein SCD90_10760 [Terrihabitans sp. PJ23]|uniref:Uncharacterized protein n=1 Tax=Terrihabitans rhizophilus TaxID=3092662 RepID=A0ABU4RNW8_9HYPH|nr:hypothetical protein [Terrihabitans sp. PJ23]